MKSLAALPYVTTIAIAVGAASAGVERAEAGYVQTNLVSDIGGGFAMVTDPSLKNPWGVSFFGSTPFWISDQGTGVSTLYSVTGSTASKIGLTVSIPTTTSGPQGPTGQAGNSNSSSFKIGGPKGAAADFVFADLNGTISAWNGGTTAITVATTSGASYTGLAINKADTELFAANDAGGGSIDVFNSSFTPISLGASAFATPTAISNAGLVPFNVQDIGGDVFVTYAPAGHPAQTGAALGEGAVAVFDENGVFQSDNIGGRLASPWGVALAPASFGKFGGDLLVGNFSFGHSEINAFDPTNWAFEGSIAIDDGPGNTPGGLWDLTFGTGGGNGSPNTLYFTDALNGEKDGLFGAIASVPEPSTWAMIALGFAGLGFAGYRRAKSANTALLAA